MSSNLKKKLSFKEQIEHINNKNIDILNEKDAFEILKFRNYYFKFKVFAKNYKKDDNNCYKCLNFESLHRLGILDTKFRSLVLNISLTCEHLLKTKICYLCTTNSQDNGYDCVGEFLKIGKRNIKLNRILDKLKNNKDKTRYKKLKKSNPYHYIRIPSEIIRFENNKFSFYTRDFMNKYYGKFAFWNFVEILTFSETIDFYSFYMTKYLNKKVQPLKFELYSAKNLRNISAHNNCVLHHFGLNMPSVKKYSDEIIKIFNTHQEKRMFKKFLIHDFLCLLYLFNKLCPSNSKLRDYLIDDIKDFLDKCKKEKDWFIITKIMKCRFILVEKMIYKVLNIN